MFNVSPFTKISVRTIRCELTYQEYWQLIAKPELPGHLGFGTGMSFGSRCGAGRESKLLRMRQKKAEVKETG